jgi:hypothetical protein
MGVGEMAGHLHLKWRDTCTFNRINYYYYYIVPTLGCQSSCSLHFAFRISDRGNGILHDIANKVWEYHFTTAGQNHDSPVDRGLFGEIVEDRHTSQMHGYVLQALQILVIFESLMCNIDKLMVTIYRGYSFGEKNGYKILKDAGIFMYLFCKYKHVSNFI